MSDPRVFELSATAKDAFDVLSGAVEIKYRDGDVWRPEPGAEEHAVVHRLRAAAAEAMTEEPGEDQGADAYHQRLLKEERRVNSNYSTFLVALEAVCHEAGMPKTVRGDEVLAWIKERLIG